MAQEKNPAEGSQNGEGYFEKSVDLDKTEDQETQNMISELQILEHEFQHILSQKNAFSAELNEVKYAIEEVKKTKGEVSKIIGGFVVIKSSRDEILNDLERKEKLIEKRLETLNSHESELSSRIEKVRSEVLKRISV